MGTVRPDSPAPEPVEKDLSTVALRTLCQEKVNGWRVPSRWQAQVKCADDSVQLCEWVARQHIIVVRNVTFLVLSQPWAEPEASLPQRPRMALAVPEDGQHRTRFGAQPGSKSGPSQNDLALILHFLHCMGASARVSGQLSVPARSSARAKSGPSQGQVRSHWP